MRAMETYRETIRQVMRDRRLTVIDRPVDLLGGWDADCIVAGLPYVRIEESRNDFAGRRRRLCLARGGVEATFLARSRPLPPEPNGGWTVVRWVLDRDGRPVPASCADGRSRTIHFLLDLDGVEVLDSDSEVLALGMLVSELFAEPVAALLEKAGEPRVGSEVGHRIASILAEGQADRVSVVEAEISLLERLVSSAALPRALLRRLDLLKRTGRKSAPSVGEEAAVDVEMARLLRLLTSRACGALRFDPNEIQGLINPRALDAETWLTPRMFHLRLGRTGGRAGRLRVWSPLTENPEEGEVRCMGEADLVLHELLVTRDLYGLVDLVLNFVETNRIGVQPLDGTPASRSLAGCVADFF